MSYNTAFHYQSGDRFEHRQGTLHEGGRASSEDIPGETLWRSCNLPGHPLRSQTWFSFGVSDSIGFAIFAADPGRPLVLTF